MFGGRLRAPTKQQHVAGARVLRGDGGEMARACSGEPLLAGRLRPIGRIGLERFGLRTDGLAPDAAHQAKAIATNPTRGGLMQVRRADPQARLRNDPVAKNAHLKRLPPSMPAPRRP